MSLDAVLTRIDRDIDDAIERLMALLRIPSISTDPAFANDCQAAAEWLVAELSELGFDAAVRPTPGRPMVVAQSGGEGPHVLFYGHYDVQPVDPLELWETDPFQPELQDTDAGRVIRARGASDDKGQLMTFVEACRAWKAETGTLPARVTIFFEGEEESGSPSLIPFLEANKAELTAEIALICDTGLFEDRRPAIVTQLRGLLGEEITITGPRVDLHSGHYGGMAMNPNRVLAGILANLHDETGRIQVPGFYDDVEEPSDALLADWDSLNFSADEFLGAVGLSVPAGEDGRRPLERVWSRPTAEICGMGGGYTGAGFKTVLPSKASAKIGFRLVAAQDPHAIRKSFRQWVSDQVPSDCTVEFAEHGAGPASRFDTGHPAFAATRAALSDEWGQEAVYVGAGGSIPVAGYFKTILGIDSVLAGFAKDSDAIHSPNEKYDVDSFHKGIRSWARVLDRIGSGG